MANTIEHDNGNGASQQAGLVVRDGFAGAETMQLAEISARAAAEQARASIEARYVMALKRPRDPDRVRVAILRECQRPAFAAVARYSKPIGGSKVEGFSIRFAEASLRALGNVYPEVATIYDDATKRIVRIAVTDLEANVTYAKDVTLEKKVERRKPRAGQRVLDKRVNSAGEVVYIVEATEDELATKEAAIASKVLRQHALRLLPGDVLDDALARITETLRAQDAKDPDFARKRLIDAFAELGVLPDQLAQYLGHPIAHLVPAELEELRSVWTALRDGESTWTEQLEARQLERGASSPAPISSSAPTATGRLADRLRSQHTTTTTIEAPPASSPPPHPSSETTPAVPSAALAELAQPLTHDDHAALTAQLASIQAELVQLVGRERARAVWSGTNGVRSLRGVRQRRHADERIAQARNLVEIAKVDAELVAARRDVERTPDGGRLLREAIGEDYGRSAFDLPIASAHDRLDRMLRILGESTPDEPQAWPEEQRGEEVPEPGSDG